MLIAREALWMPQLKSTGRKSRWRAQSLPN